MQQLEPDILMVGVQTGTMIMKKVVSFLQSQPYKHSHSQLSTHRIESMPIKNLCKKVHSSCIHKNPQTGNNLNTYADEWISTLYIQIIFSIFR